jgi:cytochrome bd-type quinol oxidase subunit 2
MDQRESRFPKFWGVVSWLCCFVTIVLAVVLCGCAAVLKAEKPRYRNTLLEFGLEVPPAADRLDAIPNSIYALATTGVIVLTVFLQMRYRRRSVASLLHLAVLSTMVLAYFLYYWPVVVPLVRLIDRLSA